VFGNGGNLFWVRSDGVGGPQRLLNRPYSAAASFSPDGHSLAYFETTADTGFDLWVLPLDITDPDHPNAGTPQPFLRTSADEVFPQFSPDGRWIAYRSDESGNNEIWVQSFPDGAKSRYQISAGGGSYVLWSKNRRELFYETPDHRIMVVDYREDGDAFIAAKPRLWSERQIFYPGVWNLDLAPDGKRFAVLTAPDAASSGRSSFHVTMLFNYFDELKRMIP